MVMVLITTVSLEFSQIFLSPLAALFNCFIKKQVKEATNYISKPCWGEYRVTRRL
jgi:hypothetical protein